MEPTPNQTSEWKIRSNRRNALLSTGPTTEEGKRASRRNAYQHGYKALIVSPDENSPAIEAARRSWIEAIQPKSDIALALADWSFRCKRRLDHVCDSEDAARAERMTDALKNFAIERRAKVDAAQDLLLESTFSSYVYLTGTVQGCERLLFMLSTLQSELDAQEWSDDSRRRLMAASGNGVDTFDEVLVELTSILTENSRPDLVAQAREGVQARIDSEKADLEERIELLAGEEERSRRLAFDRAKCDTSPEGRLLNRYVNESQRDFLKSVQSAMDAARNDQTHGKALMLADDLVQTLTSTGITDGSTAQAGSPNEPKERSNTWIDRNEYFGGAATQTLPITVGKATQTSQNE